MYVSHKAQMIAASPYGPTLMYCIMVVPGLLDIRKGKGYMAVPAYVGSLAEAKTVPVANPVQAGEQEQDMIVSYSSVGIN
eukprot:1140095-Pelagomonas_calceolata.AAC.1